MKDFRSTTIKGISWSVINQLVTQVISLGCSVVLARLLLPAEFGLIGMITVAIGFLNVLKDFGFGAALIQKKHVSSEEYNTVFWFNVFLGAVLTIGVFFSAPAIARFYKEPVLKDITRALSFTFFINSIGIVANNILLKKIGFKELFYSNSLATVLSGAAAIVFALKGFSYWSLVIQSYVNITVSTVAVMYLSKLVPRFEFKFSVLKGFFSFSLPLLGDQSLSYWTRNIDNLLIGKYLGKSSLGYYSRAYVLMLLPVRQLAGTITKVMFPSFAAIQDDIEKVKTIYLKMSRLIAMITFPIMTGLLALAKPVILIIYGNNWQPTIPIFQVLCLLGMLQSIGTLSGDIFLSQGRTALMFKVGLFSKGIMISGIIIGLFYGGLMGVAYGYTIGSVIAFLPELYFVGKLLRVTLWQIVFNFIPQLVISSIMGIVVFIFINVVKLDDLYIQALSGSCLGVLVYWLLLVVSRQTSYYEMLSLIKKKK